MTSDWDFSGCENETPAFILATAPRGQGQRSILTLRSWAQQGTPTPCGSCQGGAQSSRRVPCVSLQPRLGSLQHLRKCLPTAVTMVEQEQKTGCCRAWLSRPETRPQGGPEEVRRKVFSVNPGSCWGVLGVLCRVIHCGGLCRGMCSEAVGLQAGHRLHPECAQSLCGPWFLGIKDLPDFFTEITMKTSGCDTRALLPLLMTLGSVGGGTIPVTVEVSPVPGLLLSGLRPGMRQPPWKQKAR